MTGFLYLKAPAGFDLPSPAQFAPRGTTLAWNLKRQEASEALWTWGGAAGDIRVGGGGEGRFVTLSGYITGLKEGPSFRSQAEVADFLLKAFERDADPRAICALAERAHGSFSVLFRSQQLGRLICLSDRVASRPLWLYKRDGVTAVSTHPSSIAAALGLTTFDTGAMASLLLYGGPMDPRKSLFKGISGLAAGSLLELDDHGGARERRWYTFRHNPDSHLSRTEWTRVAADRLVAAAERILKLGESPVIFFSGGTDSRLAAAAMKAAGGRPLLLTLGDSVNTEAKVARQAARALGLPHEILLRDRYHYLRGLRRAVFESAGNYVWTHGHFSQAAEQIGSRQPGAAFMLGDFCEAFSKLCCSVPAVAGSALTQERFLAEFDRLPLPLYQPRNRDASLSLLARDARDEAVVNLRESLATRYTELRPGTADPAVFADQFLRWEQTGTIATFFMFLNLRSAGADRNLMFDRDVQGLLEVLPAAMRNSANLGARLIAKLWPRAAWVPNSNSLLPMCFPPAAHQFTKTCKPLLGKVRRWWMGNPYTTTASWPQHHVLYLNDPKWRRFIEGVIDEAESLDQAVFDPGAIRQAWQELGQGKQERALDIQKVVLFTHTVRMLKTGVSRYLAEAEEEAFGADSPERALATAAKVKGSEASQVPTHGQSAPQSIR
ncbi:MAG: hypothetical protein AB9869_21765 [Verrucomicrobiia bacterium]